MIVTCSPRGMFLASGEGVFVMGRGHRPVCIGMYGAEEDCQICTWRDECQDMSENIEAAATRKGTHVRIVSKYKEKKYKPKRVP